MRRGSWLGCAISTTLLVWVCACGPSEPPAAVVVPTASAAPPPPPVSSAACDDDYRAAAAPSGSSDLPPVPELPSSPKKDGESFTVFGAAHALRSRFESEQVTKGEITIVGWIVDSNVPRAPKCAWHKTGIRDPDTCVAEIPSFVIADAKDTKPDDPKLSHIKVLGWARNFAVVFDATTKYKGLTAAPKPLVLDELWNVEVPFPIPATGTKVKVKGRYAFSFTKSSSGIVTDPKNGVLTFSSLEVVR